MQKAPWLLFWASVAAFAFGIADRVTTGGPIITGIAAGSYWKAGMALVACSIALNLLNSESSKT
jgi:hypothetical protein